MIKIFNLYSRFIFIAASLLVGTVLSCRESFAQYTVHVRANTLDHSMTGSPIAGAVISKDLGDVVEVTDSNGEATLTKVGGTISIKVLQPDYKQFVQTFNIISDTTLYFAMPMTIRVGPWGTDTLNTSWWKDIYSTATSVHDPTRWEQIIPVNTQISDANQTDSIRIFAAADTMNKSTGYNLFKFISNASTDTTYVVFMHSYTNASYIGSDVNGIATGGGSLLTNNDVPRITHEIVKSQDGWPTSNIPVPTNADPMMQTRPPWQPLDGDYLSLKIEENFRKKNGRQSFFIYNMSEYVALGNVGQVSITNPSNNSTGADTLLNIIGTKDSCAIWYDFKVTTDLQGNNVIQSQTGTDRPRITVNLHSGTTYFLFERTRNNTSTGAWSSPTQITTLILPGPTTILTPVNYSTKVLTPVQYILAQSTNASQYEVMAAADSSFTSVFKDTLVSAATLSIPLPNGQKVYSRARGINSYGNGPWSLSIQYTIIKGTPGIISISYPLNNSDEVVQPVSFTSSTTANAEKYEFILTDVSNSQLLDTICSNNGFSFDKLNGNRTFKIKVRAMNSDLFGNWSDAITFTTFDNPPVVSIVSPIGTDSVNVSDPMQFKWQASDTDNDPLTFSLRIWCNTQDTSITNITDTSYILIKGFLKPQKTYNYSVTANDGKKSTTSSTGSFKTRIVTGLESFFIDGSLRIYPIPAHDQLHIDFKAGFKEVFMRIFSLDGICKSNNLLTNPHSEVDISNLKPGVYILDFIQFTERRKLIIKE